MNQLRFIKLSFFGCVLLIAMLMLTGCNRQALSDNFDETEVKEAAVMIVDLINAQDTDSLIEFSTPRLRAAITEDVWDDVFAAISEGGPFDTIDKLSIRGMTDRSSGEAYAVVTVSAQYEHRIFVFTISFTEKMELTGLYYR